MSVEATLFATGSVMEGPIGTMWDKVREQYGQAINFEWVDSSSFSKRVKERRIGNTPHIVFTVVTANNEYEFEMSGRANMALKNVRSSIDEILRNLDNIDEVIATYYDREVRSEHPQPVEDDDVYEEEDMSVEEEEDKSCAYSNDTVTLNCGADGLGAHAESLLLSMSIPYRVEETDGVLPYTYACGDDGRHYFGPWTKEGMCCFFQNEKIDPKIVLYGSKASKRVQNWFEAQ